MMVDANQSQGFRDKLSLGWLENHSFRRQLEMVAVPLHETLMIEVQMSHRAQD